MSGPLAPWASGIAERLKALGYRPRMVERHLQLAGGLSRFMQRRGVAASELGPELIEQYVGVMRARNSSWRPTAKTLTWLVDYMRQIGLMAAPAASLADSVQQGLIDSYREYLTVERGLQPTTVANYERVVRLFLALRDDRALGELSAAEVSRFMTSQCRQVSARAAERLATGLRSFLGFALVEG